VTGDKQHYLPAAVIGGFGETGPGAPLREAKVLWRRREWDQARTTVAHRIGYENRMYRLSEPPDGMNPDTVDELWDHFEQPLPAAIARTAKRRESSDDHRILKGYAAAASVRHPDFAKAVNRWRAGLSMPLVEGDRLQLERVTLLSTALRQVEGFRWRIVHRPPFGPRFVLNDRGWTYIGEEGRQGRGLWIPLSTEIGMLAWLQRGEGRSFDHATLWPGWAKWLNAATWEEAPSFIVAHPDDMLLIEEPEKTGEAALKLERPRPYQNRSLQSLFSDFT
jgi:hypothetical protein